eukprot:122704_1
MFDKIQQIDIGLSRYYIIHGMKTYLNDDGIGRFRMWCEQHAYDTDLISEELKEEPDASNLQDFDEEFPMHDAKRIHSIVKECWKNPNAFVEETIDKCNTLKMKETDIKMKAAEYQQKQQQLNKLKHELETQKTKYDQKIMKDEEFKRRENELKTMENALIKLEENQKESIMKREKELRQRENKMKLRYKKEQHTLRKAKDEFDRLRDEEQQQLVKKRDKLIEIELKNKKLECDRKKKQKMQAVVDAIQEERRKNEWKQQNEKFEAEITNAKEKKDELLQKLSYLENECKQDKRIIKSQNETINSQKDQLKLHQEFKIHLENERQRLSNDLKLQLKKIKEIEDEQRKQQEKEQMRQSEDEKKKQEEIYKEKQRIESIKIERQRAKDEMQRLVRCSPDKYKFWETNDFILWIMGLEGGIFSEYKHKIEEMFYEQKISGEWLCRSSIKIKTLQSWGISSREHCYKLLKHIVSTKLQNKCNIFKMQNKNVNVTNISKVLVISVGIAFYDNEIYDDLYSTDNKQNEHDIATDMRNYRHVFGDQYGYTLITNDDLQYEMTDSQLNTFLLNCRTKICSPIDKSQVFYDSIILTFGGHGYQDGIICSDGNKVSWSVIRGIFDDELLRKIPRIYLIDTCRTYEGIDNTVKFDNGACGGMSTTIFANSEGKSVRGGMISKWITHAFKTHFNKNKTLNELCDIAEKNILQSSGQKLIIDETDRTVLKIVFKPNDKVRGRPRNLQKNEHTQSG